MSDQPNHSDDFASRGLLYCFVLVVFAVSAVGFMTGTNVRAEHLRREKTQIPESPVGGKVATARSYRQMRDTPRGQGSGWEEAVNIAARQPPLPAKPGLSLDLVLHSRQTRRAYDGAPPTIPHFVQQNSAAECMACHAEGLRLGERQARVIPHGALTNCVQCHVPETAPAPGQNLLPPDPRGVTNHFVGQAAPKSGARAWNIAPPQIPHSSFMRENCISCHGSAGSSPMRSSHLDRQNCTQCHTASAELDLRPGVSRP